MFGLTSDPTALVFIVLIDVVRHGMLLSLLNRHILITVYRGTSSRVRARVDIAVEICLTILTDAVGAAVTLVVVPVQFWGINKKNFVFFAPNACPNDPLGTNGIDLVTPAYVVALSLLFKFMLFCVVRFTLLRDYSIDMVNLLHYLSSKWRWTILSQLVSSACIVYVLLLNQGGVVIIEGVFQGCGGDSVGATSGVGN
jgi:hypothetical protein